MRITFDFDENNFTEVDGDRLLRSDYFYNENDVVEYLKYYRLKTIYALCRDNPQLNRHIIQPSNIGDTYFDFDLTPLVFTPVYPTTNNKWNDDDLRDIGTTIKVLDQVLLNRCCEKLKLDLGSHTLYYHIPSHAYKIHLIQQPSEPPLFNEYEFSSYTFWYLQYHYHTHHGNIDDPHYMFSQNKEDIRRLLQKKF